MGELRARMEGDLRLKGVAEVTRTEYLRCTCRLAAYYRRSPAALGADEVRAYLLHLTSDLPCSPANLKMQVAARKCLYRVTLNRPAVVEKIPYPKVPRGLLDIPSPGDVAKVLGALRSPQYRMVLFCAYGSGLRVSEACNLCIGDIDSQRMLLHGRAGKGGRDRYAMLSPVLLDSLRHYYRTERAEKPFLFPAHTPAKPVRPEGVQTAACAARSLTVASPSASRPTPRGIASRHICWKLVTTFVRFRSCSATVM
jgi:integrase/recombinase XerD